MGFITLPSRMKQKLPLLVPFLFTIFLVNRAFSQESTEKKFDLGELHGNFQVDAQLYNPDSAIGAPPVPEKLRSNIFGNFIYTRKLGPGSFIAGVRYEAYLPALLGFDSRYAGVGLPYRFIQYQWEGLDVTVGNFYDQFGSGMVFRSFEERNLGYDNAMDGLRVKYTLFKGIHLKGIIGLQRFFMTKGPGLVRGFDGEIDLNETFKFMNQSKFKMSLGGSFVSKYQSDQDPVYKLPENVGMYGIRANIQYGGFTLNGEYVHKVNDPSTANNFIYRKGEALLLNAGFSVKNFGIALSAKRVDNMNFRSDRTATGNNLSINFLPALTRQHTYNLAATIYPYATQPNGEMAGQVDVNYTFPRGTALGGKYGTTLLFNYSIVNGLDTVQRNDGYGYDSPFFKIGRKPYWHDFNFQIDKKVSKEFKFSLMYMNFLYDKDVVQGLAGYGVITGHIGVLDMTLRLPKSNTLHWELQGLYADKQKDFGHWVTGLIEFNYHSKFFVAVQDQWNVGNKDSEKRIHYLTGSAGYTLKTTRITLTYGRQRAGIFCVGGVCRTVPASNGLSLSITSNF